MNNLAEKTERIFALDTRVFYKLGIPDYMSFVLTMVITGIVCTISFDFFLRSGTIGLFLNGRKYTRIIVNTPKQLVNITE